MHDVKDGVVEDIENIYQLLEATEIDEPLALVPYKKLKQMNSNLRDFKKGIIRLQKELDERPNSWEAKRALDRVKELEIKVAQLEKWLDDSRKSHFNTESQLKLSNSKIKILEEENLKLQSDVANYKVQMFDMMERHNQRV